MGRSNPGFGLVLLDARLTADELTAKGVGTRDSAYTEDDPQPGLAVPDDAGSSWRPQVSAAQSAELDLYTVWGGYAGREGAEVLYRLAADTDGEDYRGWSDPNLITGFSGGGSSLGTVSNGPWGSSCTWTSVVACATPAGYLVIVAVDDSAGVGQAWRYNVRTGVWTVGHAFAAGAPGLEGPIGIVYDADHERVILYSGAAANSGLKQAGFYSADNGLTFLGYTRRSLGGSTATGLDVGAFRVASRPGGLDWLLFTVDETDGTGECVQYASSDSGVQWELVDNVANTRLGCWPVWTGTHFLVAYRDNATGNACVRLLASARAVFDDAAEVIVDSTVNHQVIVPVVDADGVVYLYTTREAAGTVTPDLRCYRSVDGGLTWETYIVESYSTGSAATMWHEWQAAAALCGCVYLVGHGVGGNTQVDNTIGILRLGGWAQVAHGPGTHGTVLGHERRAAWGVSIGTTAIEARAFIPSCRPDQQGWADSSGAGNTSISLAVQEWDAMQWSAAAGSPREWVYTCTGSAKSSIMFETEVYGVSGENRAAALARGTGNLHATLRLSDGATFEYDVLIHFSSDGIALQDGNGGATIESVALTMGSASSPSFPVTWTRVRVYLVAGRVDWWYAQGTGDLAEQWTKGVGGTVSNGAAATQSRVIWGCGAIPVLTSARQRFLGVAFGGEWQHGIETLAEWEKSYSAGVRGHVQGRPIPGRSSPYPIPELTSDTEDVGYLSATGGPTYVGETVNLPVSSTYAIDSVHPISSPSPRDRWRATGTAEVLLVYDLGDAQWYGDALALLVCGGRPAQWVLETDDGSTGWTTQGTLDLTLGSSLTFTRTGAVVVANGGTAVTRYLRENELAGGYLVSGSVAAEILTSSAGWWGGSSRQQVRITLAAVGSFPSSGSNLSIVCPNGILIVYPTSAVLRRYVRIRAAASAVVPDSKYGAGILGVGRVIGVGADPAWTWTSERRLNVRRTRSSDGVSDARELGPIARRLSYSWPDYQDMLILREAADWVATSSGLVIGTGEDSATLGEVLTAVASGEAPVVVVPRLPSSTSTILDREAFVFGRVSMDSLGVTGKQGTEGTNETVTVGALTVDELV